MFTKRNQKNSTIKEEIRSLVIFRKELIKYLTYTENV